MNTHNGNCLCTTTEDEIDCLPYLYSQSAAKMNAAPGLAGLQIPANIMSSSIEPRCFSFPSGIFFQTFALQKNQQMDKFWVKFHIKKSLNTEHKNKDHWKWSTMLFLFQEIFPPYRCKHFHSKSQHWHQTVLVLMELVVWTKKIMSLLQQPTFGPQTSTLAWICLFKPYSSPWGEMTRRESADKRQPHQHIQGR